MEYKNMMICVDSLKSIKSKVKKLKLEIIELEEKIKELEGAEYIDLIDQNISYYEKD